MRRATKATSNRQIGISKGFRSGLEEKIDAYLHEAGVPFAYEEVKIPYDVHKHCKYTPDFVLPNGIIIESKGRFVTADRQKHLLIKEQHPLLDIRFVFHRSASKISKQSKTTYAKWCEDKGFLYVDKLIPQDWLKEPPNWEALRAIMRLFEEQGKAFPSQKT